MSLLLLKIKALDNDDHDNSIDNNNNNDKDDNSIINNISIDNDTNIHYHCCNHHHHYRKINKNTRIQRKKNATSNKQSQTIHECYFLHSKQLIYAQCAKSVLWLLAKALSGVTLAASSPKSSALHLILEYSYIKFIHTCTSQITTISKRQQCTAKFLRSVH